MCDVCDVCGCGMQARGFGERWVWCEVEMQVQPCCPVLTMPTGLNWSGGEPRAESRELEWSGGEPRAESRELDWSGGEPRRAGARGLAVVGSNCPTMPHAMYCWLRELYLAVGVRTQYM